SSLSALLSSQLFLDDAKVKNFITCFKDKKFLVFFFKQLKVNRSGRYQEAFPYLSPCGREHNYIRCDDRPIVFTQLLRGPAGEELLSYCGGGDKLAVPFQPEKLLMLPENGRLYHPAPEKAGGAGLVKSALAFELSPCFEYGQGPAQPPTHFHWQDRPHVLTNELLQLLRDGKGKES
uniref:Chromosome 8 open reading frame 82 n=1 Tax=Sphenodon punctatus TaxID=8508 RepID=A0A8D0HR92_SPHPU